MNWEQLMKINYICDCLKTNYNIKNFAYWENREVTSDEIDIINFIEKNYNLQNKKILHIGIGNSFLAKSLSNFNKIYGISVSFKEIELAKKSSINNYEVNFCDKYSVNFVDIFHNIRFDFIIDPNLKSYSCCNKSFNYMFENLNNSLNYGGTIITSRKGMQWYKKLLPKLSFSLKNLLHYKLKEVNGDPNNIMTIEETNNLCKKYSLELFFDEKICCIKK